MDRHNTTILHEEPEHAGIELADVAQFKQPLAQAC
jgi:hypothetical protein